ncbi:glycosyltransferase involved in cell wall biosynthesis [Litorivivens lipolytica]|uniref:Glycosyltransferase involved in cell wall biosynthesis n=1 Tax=Litorivivens lipolytica TaxID=1524264 RepID=A0A7W4W5G3_9GAMM|nr:glycosyltransferase family 4 protein [Litorivivens lipolytica]MBB3047831.1 glycosyltransferase involved in cell wall biosynthesis [Litorivivens lipolytica]
MPTVHSAETRNLTVNQGVEIDRVAIVAPNLDILGGQGVQAFSLAEALAKDGIQVDFVAVNPRFPKGLRWVRRIPLLRTLLNQIFYTASLLRLRDADVVHIFSASYWSFMLAPLPALIAAKLFSKPSVLNYHSGEADDHLRNWGYRVHPWLRLADRIVVPSVYLQQTFRRYGYHADVVCNVIDLDAFTYRQRVSIKPRLLSNRNLESHYGVDKILKAFAILKRSYPQATLTVAGYGSQEKSLRQWVAAEGISDIQFVGRIEPELMPALYNRSDIFINASSIDNQPISILEAFASGLTVISTPIGDIPNMMGEGERGLLLENGDPSSIADAVRTLLECPSQGQELARRARADVERYTWAQVRDCWINAYHSAAAAHRPDNAINRKAKFDETTTHS